MRFIRSEGEARDDGDGGGTRRRTEWGGGGGGTRRRMALLLLGRRTQRLRDSRVIQTGLASLMASSARDGHIHIRPPPRALLHCYLPTPYLQVQHGPPRVLLDLRPQRPAREREDDLGFPMHNRTMKELNARTNERANE